ncbi:Rieske (2Fe-2S) protein [Haloparvum sp. AD34]
MRDAVRVSIESEYEEDSARIHDDSGQVETSDATFSFSIDGNGHVGDDVGSAGPEPEPGPDPEPEQDASSEEETEPRHVAPLREVPTDSTIRCEAVHGRRGVELILRREGDEVFAWRNSCPHKPKVSLDPGNGAIVDDDQIVCHEHGARFECGDGYCSYGPCRGDELEEFDVEVRDGDVYLADDRFDACNRLAY